MMNDKRDIFNIIDAGNLSYRDVFELQKELASKRITGDIKDSIVLAEHPPVFTIGRKGSLRNMLVDEEAMRDKGLELIRVDRGGDITFHGPGQITLYPIMDLKALKKDLNLYIRTLENAVMDFLSSYGIIPICIPGATGVWMDKYTKIASIGITVKKWVTYHGLSVNINTPLSYFDMIKPCGLEYCKMVSLASVLGRLIDMDNAKERLIDAFTKRIEGTYAIPSLGEKTHSSFK